MLKRDKEKKKAQKTGKTSKAMKGAKTKLVETKIPEKTQKKLANPQNKLKKPLS